MQKPLIPAFLLLLGLLVAGCGKTTDDLPENIDRWVVSRYNNTQIGSDLTDDTALFTGYLFEFNTDNTLAITEPDGKVKQAKWAEVSGASFIIGMDNPTDPLTYIVGDWEIIEYTATDIKLRKTNIDAEPGVVYKPELEFTKQ